MKLRKRKVVSSYDISDVLRERYEPSVASDIEDQMCEAILGCGRNYHEIMWIGKPSDPNESGNIECLPKEVREILAEGTKGNIGIYVDH